MKKALILLLALLMVFQGITVFAEEPAEEPEAPVEETEAPDEAEETPEETEELPELEYNYDELTVGTITPFEGSFFNGLWGNVTSDLDVRILLHGYNLVEWNREAGGFALDPSVVSGAVVTQNAAGDRTYTLTIYNDMVYSDGTPITARDYAFSMLLNIAPQMAEIGGSVRNAEYLVGYANYINGNTPYLSGIRVIDEDTLAITISSQYLPFFYELGLLDCTPYPIHVIAPGCRVADDGNGVYIANEDAEAAEPVFTAELLRETVLNAETGYLSHPSVSCGPYTLVSFDGNQVELEINPLYKGNSDGNKPTIQKLIYKVVSNETMIDELSKGELGLINKAVSAEELTKGVQLIADNNMFTMSNYTRSGMSFISFCCENEPVNSAEVRKAIAACLDKDGLVADTVGSYGIRVDGYYGMGQWMYGLVEGNTPYPVDPPAEDADEKAYADYEAEIAEWDALSLENATVYEFGTEAAAELLEAEGWTSGREGEAYAAETSDVRCKTAEDGSVKTLELKMLVPEGSSLNEHYQANFVDHLAEIGIILTIEEKPMNEVLQYYYRQVDRSEYAMIAMATNFDVMFEPSISFRPDAEGAVNYYNTTAINDEELYAAAVDMRQTEPDDLLGYCQKWVTFEEKFQEAEPFISIYSNVYFDFYPRVLHDYEITSNVSWGLAIVNAYMSDVSDEELAGELDDEDIELEEDEEPEEGEEPVEDEEPEEP